MFNKTDKERQDFLKNGNINSVNKYFNELERLSNQKGGKYKDIFLKDVNYFQNYDIDTINKKKNQSGGEYVTNLINKIPPNRPFRCRRITDIGCDKSSIQLQNMKIILNYEVDCKRNKLPLKNPKGKKAIGEFIDYLTCCSGYFYDENNNPDGSIIKRYELKHVKDILKIILSDKDMSLYGYNIFQQVVLSDQSLHNNQFIIDLHDLFEKAIRKHYLPILYERREDIPNNNKFPYDPTLYNQ